MGVPTPTLRHLLPTTPQNPHLLFTPDNTLFHTANARVQLTDPIRGRTRTLPHEATRNILSLSHSNNYLLSVDEASRVTLQLLPTGRVTARLSLSFPVSAASISPDGAHVAFVGQRVEVWKLPTAPIPQFAAWTRIAQFAAPGVCVAWSNDSARIAVGASRLATVYTLTERQQGVRVKPLVLHGHRETLIAVHFVGERGLTTVSADGVLFCWRLRYRDQEENYGKEMYPYADNEARNPKRKFFQVPVAAKLVSRHFITKGGARIARSAHICEGMIVTGMSNGHFALFQLPDSMTSEDETFDRGLFEIGEMRKRKRAKLASGSKLDEPESELLDDNIPVIPFTELTLLHTLSVSNGPISRITFNHTGDWVALSSSTGQVVVWDWRSETYVLKQQAHLLESSAVAFSPDGSAIATGSKDGLVKLWGLASGFCVTTFTEHTGSVTALTFAAKDVIVSASTDGSVRAFDLRKYRNFRTMVGPPPVRRFACVAVDQAGDLIAAGCSETFEIVVWSLRTGQVLELLNGHKGPVSGVAFRPHRGTLATSSWDRTVRLWDMYERKGSCEVLEHSKEVLDVAFRPDGKEFAACTASGEVILWNPESGGVVGTIDGSRDAAPGRLRDSRTVAPLKGHFKSISYNADGRFLIAGAASKHVCIYHISEGSRPTMVNQIAVTKNQNFDGLLDELNSKYLSASGHQLDTIEDDNEEAEDFQEIQRANKKSLPGATAEEKLRRKKLLKAEVNCVHACATGRLWAAVSTEGILIYGDSEGDEYGEVLFDPANLEIDVTPQAARKAADERQYALALAVALRLNERTCLNDIIERVPFEEIVMMVNSLSTMYFSRLIHLFAWRLENTPHLEFNLTWTRRLMLAQGARAHERISDPATVDTALRALSKACAAHSKRLKPVADKNEHMLRYLVTIAKRKRELAGKSELIKS